MEEQILKIAEDLKQGTITETKARTLLLGLFGVSNSVCNHEWTAKGKPIRMICSKCGKLYNPQTDC